LLEGALAAKRLRVRVIVPGGGHRLGGQVEAVLEPTGEGLERDELARWRDV
jgi:hypothetical protein